MGLPIIAGEKGAIEEGLKSFSLETILVILDKLNDMVCWSHLGLTNDITAWVKLLILKKY